MDWLKQLGKDNRGSRARCVLLVDGGEKGVAVREGCVLRQEIGVSTLGMIRGAVGFLTLTTAGCDDPEPTATPTAVPTATD